MGVHAKYDLTKYGFQSRTPATYYTCDKFLVSVFDGYETYEHWYDTWKDAANYYQRKLKELEEFPHMEMNQISITGLVFN